MRPLWLQAGVHAYLGVSGELVLEHGVVGVHRAGDPPTLFGGLAHVRAAELGAVLAPSLVSHRRQQTILGSVRARTSFVVLLRASGVWRLGMRRAAVRTWLAKYSRHASR